MGDQRQVDPGPGTRTNTIGHPVERMLNASARDILDALENEFRARADLKGKLAELFMIRQLDRLQRDDVIDHSSGSTRMACPTSRSGLPTAR